MELPILTSQKPESNSNTSYTPYAEDPSFHNQLSQPQPHSKRKRNYTKGWRFGAINCALSTTVVFFINLVVTLWTSRRDPRAPNTLLDGDCTRVKRLNTGIHLLINILSTIILSSSNYCMQCLSAPTRREIDVAHAKGTWLDIGIPSMRNLWRINPWRTVLWLLLGLSSLPLHLFYNSAVFSSISSNDYYAITVSQSFLDDTECTNCTYEIFDGTRQEWVDGIVGLHAQARNGSLERLEPAECIAQYAQFIQSNRRNVFLVASDDNFNSSADNQYYNGTRIYYNSYFSASNALGDASLDVYQWICSGLVDWTECRNKVDQIKAAPETWRVGNENGYPVQYCLSEKAEPHCKLQFSLAIGILVTVLNLVKALLMFYVAFFIEDPLVTIGDAIASFLEHNDPTTKNMCLLSYKDMKASKSGYRTGPKEYRSEIRRWKDVLSRTRRIVTVTMFAIAIAIVSALLHYGLRSLPSQQSKSLSALAKLGFGAVDPMVVIIWSVKGMISNSLVANAAQPILSFLYFSYNACFTAMLSGVEWCSYSMYRKGLRLSHAPQGAQRSTYFLQLPYRFALPMMVMSGLLHWFVSQSIFLVAIDYYNNSGVYENDDKVCGFSPIAIIAVIILGCVMMIALVAVGWVPYKRSSGIPLAGSCSMAISAACHVKDWIDDSQGAFRRKLLWGVVDTGSNNGGIGHCAFSPGEVSLIEHGKCYAGTRRRETTMMTE